MLGIFTWGQWLLAVMLIFVCFLLMIVILLQKGRGGGLAGAFGGAGGTSAFGAKTGDVFTWITVVVAAVFVLLTVVSNFAFDQSARPQADAVVQPVTQDIPLEGAPATPAGEPIRIELGTTDPTTGEKSTRVIPVGPGGTATLPLKPADSPPVAPPPAQPAAEPQTKPEEKPAGAPKEDEPNRPNP
jgi:preprotein translocase subunit SecG